MAHFQLSVVLALGFITLINGQCTTTPVNETALCASVNSSALDQFLNGVTPNAAVPLSVCNFTVLQFACLPTLSRLTSQQLADLLACKLPSNVAKDTWKLFFTKTDITLDDALLKFSNMTLPPSNVSLSDVLDVIAEVRIDRFSPQRLSDPTFIRSWFQGRLKPFLPSVSEGFLSCLSTKNLTCETYQTITQAFVNTAFQDGQDVCNPIQPNVARKQDLIYTDFMKAFLSRNDTDDPRCLRDTANTMQWVTRNFGPFVQSASLKDLRDLYSNFTTVEVLPLLGLNQLLEYSVTPGALTDPQKATNFIQVIKDCQLATFFNIFSPRVQNLQLSPDVKAALIKQVFDRANLTNLSIPNDEVLAWIQIRMKPLLANLSVSLVSPFFTILNTRDCNFTQTILRLLDDIRATIPINTNDAIYNSILESFKGPNPLRCYIKGSFITFLNVSLFGFGPLPNLTTLFSLIPPARTSELVNSLAPSELGTYLRHPGVVNNDSQICVIFNNFNKTPNFLDTETVLDNIKSAILPCIWPLALTSENEKEINLWFDSRLKPYLKFLNPDIIGSQDTLNASCISYKKIVNVLGNNFNFNGSLISRDDVYTTIKTYLQADPAPKCYNPSDARLNSTAWFVNYIGAFIDILSVDDLYSFGSEDVMKIFSVNAENIKLFNQNTLPQNLTSRYTELIFLQNPTFNILQLPSVLQCNAPAAVFTTLNENQTNSILENFKTSCSDVDPSISTALAGNIKTITADAITNLGNEIVGLTTLQINSAPPAVLISSLSKLSAVSGWSFGQSKAIIGSLLSGALEINTSSSLQSLGSLIGGIPSTFLTNINPSEISQAIQNTDFVKNVVAAPEILQRTFVNQVIKLNTSTTALLHNIPDDLAMQIPRNLLIIPTALDSGAAQLMNKKKWKPEQAVLFFDTVANAFDQADTLSVEVLQGFTCSRVQKFSQIKIKGLIQACRQRLNRPKVELSETQLTCMYNLVKNESPMDFSSYHPDMLLYYNYETIVQSKSASKCLLYFTALGAADVSIFSKALSGRKDTLIKKAMDCLGIVGKILSKQHLGVLGNLACGLSSEYILNSDPEILENLKNCKDLSDAQTSAMETLLMKGTPKYGPKSSWNQKTLGDLGNLLLHLSQNFWSTFKKTDKKKFMQGFVKNLLAIKTPKKLMAKLFMSAISTALRTKRAAADCTEGFITSVNINDDSFPFGYDLTQFTNCLNATVVKDNLASLCDNIYDSSFQRVVLDKLKEVFPSGLSDDQVQLLKSVSRNATVDELSKWNITKIDTLAALMDTYDGEWTSAQSQQIIAKYLSAGNSLNAAELNLLKGPNLCSLDTSTLSTILPESIRGSDALDVSTCSSDNKKTLFTTANKAFPMTQAANQSILTSFQLIEPYLGGADLSYVRSLSTSNISMSGPTFMNLDQTVINSLTVSEVVGLFGNNLPDLKTYENETAVQSWISLQLQSELDKLNLNLTGGRLNTTAAPVTSTASTIVNATSVNAGSATPGASGWSVSFRMLVLICTLSKVEII